MARLVLVTFAALALLCSTSANSSAHTIVPATPARGPAAMNSIDGRRLLVERFGLHPTPAAFRQRGARGGTGTSRPAARPRGGQPSIGRAAGRTSPPFGRRVFARPFFVSPFAFSAFGLGFFAYDPFFWGPWGYPAYWGPFWGYSPYGYDGYAGPYAYAGYNRDGAVKLDVKPKNAEVYADGDYVGEVRDFDGAFHHLELAGGEHKIEVRASGYEPLTVNVRIMPGRTVTYRGELEPAGGRHQSLDGRLPANRLAPPASAKPDGCALSGGHAGAAGDWRNSKLRSNVCGAKPAPLAALLLFHRQNEVRS